MHLRSAFAAVACSSGIVACSMLAGLPSDYSLILATDASPPGVDVGAPTDAPPDVAVGAVDACLGCGVVTLAPQENGPKEIVVAGSSLYWTTSDAVRTCTAPDCADVRDFCPANDARGIALAGASVYWAERGANQISWATRQGGGCGDAGSDALGGIIPQAGSTLDGLTVDDASVYWAATGDNRIWRANLDGTDAATLGDPSYLNGPSWVGVDGTLVYVASQYAQNDNGVVVIDTTDGGHQNVAQGGQTLRLALDDTNVYFTDRVEASGSGAVRYEPKTGFDGDAGVLIAIGSSGPIGLTVDRATRTIYWTNQFDGNVLKCSIDACTTPTVVASAQGEPWGLAVDAEFVYWTNRNNDAHSAGQVMRAPK